MFRVRDPQMDLFEPTRHFLTDGKRERLGATWAATFREKALPLIEEEPFAKLYDDANGRPNQPVQVVLGVLLLKEMFDLTDRDALEQLEYSLLWQHALRLSPNDAHLCQKTLHNFRAGLMRCDGARLAFEEVTAAIIKKLGIKVGRQRIDSTHIVSNFAILTRLGLFTETIRVFLARLRRRHAKLFRKITKGLRSRYLDENGAPSGYGDARSEDGKRRLAVVARDLYRIVERARGTAAEKLDEFAALERLLAEQCEVVKDRQRPDASEDDAGEGAVPVVLKDPKEIRSDSLQTPHDPDATYSGHKGKGYEVQIAETCAPENPVEIITQVEVTQSCESDDGALLPTLESLEARELKPDEIVADTTYGSAANAVAAEMVGTELVAPVPGTAPEIDGDEKNRALSAGDFQIPVSREHEPEILAICPAGHHATRREVDPVSLDKVTVHFDARICDACPLRARCPAKKSFDGSEYVLTTSFEKANIERRRLAAKRGELKQRLKIRAGIEATNSELKRRHGLGHLRVRRRERVELVVYLKALACNLKRMVCALMAKPAVAAA